MFLKKVAADAQHVKAGSAITDGEFVARRNLMLPDDPPSWIMGAPEKN